MSSLSLGRRNTLINTIMMTVRIRMGPQIHDVRVSIQTNINIQAIN